MSSFSAEFFTGNRRELLKRSKVGLVVVAANSRMQRSNDTWFKFKQNSNFWYLSGIEQPDVTVAFSPSQSFAILPPTSETERIFNGQTSSQAIKKIAGLDEVLEYRAGWQKLARLVKKSKQIGVIAGKMPRVNFVINPANKALSQKLGRINNQANLVDIRSHLAALRMIKQVPELSAIQSAIDLTLEGFNEVSDQLKNLKNEAQIEAFIGQHFIKNGANHGYLPIVAAGKSACTLHYTDNNRPLGGKQLLIDAGAEINNYSADITRTIPLKPSTRFDEVFTQTLHLQNQALKLLKPGITLKEYEKKLAPQVTDSINKLLSKKSFSNASTRKYYPHATSHHLGLDVHDAADYSKPLQENMVLTVEPGIYIPEEGIGVRIEDDVLITKNGCQVLSKKLPAVYK